MSDLRITGHVITRAINYYPLEIEEAKELIEELSHSYITSEVVKNLLSQLQDFVTENELAQRTNSPT